MYKASQFYTVKDEVFLKQLVYLMSARNSEPYQIFDQRHPDEEKASLEFRGNHIQVTV